MGKADYLKLGDWNAQCFRCGFKNKAGELRKQWQGYWVCTACWEPRQPQDFAKGVPDLQTVPWSQPDNWTFVGPGILQCTPVGRTAIADQAVADCSICNVVNSGYFQ